MAGLVSALCALVVLLLAFLDPSLATVIVTGATGGVNLLNGSRPFRQEITAFQSSGPAFDLFILGLRAFQQTDQSNVTSYYQIAGIHGVPFKAWDGVTGGYQEGYCTHNSVVFPPWHRPYLALFEQILWNHARIIAKTYPVSLRNKYVAAASTLRLPYWDWAVNPMMPTSCTTPMITVNTPLGEQSIDNPLYNYTFHPLPLGTDFPTNQALSNYRSTVRYPNNASQSQQAVANQVLASEGATIHTLTYQILTSENNYTMMASAEIGSYDSIENLHNGVHQWVGGSGHMALIPWSSYDPLFWLHHANIDRIFAFWQILNPASYVEPAANILGTFTEPPNFVETMNTPLTPFHSSPSVFYSSATVRSTRPFGYTYPDIVDWGVNASQLQSNVRANINALYNPTTSPAVKRGLRKIKSPKGKEQGHELLPLIASATNQTVEKDITKLGGVTLQKCVQMGINNLPMQWAATFQVDRFILSNPFSIHIFLTTPPADTSQWATCPQHVGSGAIFTTANTTAMPSTIISGQVPLTHALAQAVDDGILPNLDPATVVPLLTSSLEWRIQKADNEAVDAKDLVDGKGKGGLRIGVMSRVVTPRVAADAFPVYGEWTSWPSVTADKAGGAGTWEKAVAPA